MIGKFKLKEWLIPLFIGLVILFILDASGQIGSKKTLTIKNIRTGQQYVFKGALHGIVYDRRSPEERKFYKLFHSRKKIEKEPDSFQSKMKYSIIISQVFYGRGVRQEIIEISYDPKGILLFEGRGRGRGRDNIFRINNIEAFNKIIEAPSDHFITSP